MPQPHHQANKFAYIYPLTLPRKLTISTPSLTLLTKRSWSVVDVNAYAVLIMKNTVLRHGPGYRPSCPLVAPPIYPDSPHSSPAAPTARTAPGSTQRLLPILPKPTASESPGERPSTSGKDPVHISPEITKPSSPRTTPHHSASHTLPAQPLVWSEVHAAGHPRGRITVGPNGPAKAKPYDRPLPLGAQSFTPTPIDRPRLGDATAPSTAAPLSPPRTPSWGSDEYWPRNLSIDREYTINGHQRPRRTSGPK